MHYQRRKLHPPQFDPMRTWKKRSWKPRRNLGRLLGSRGSRVVYSSGIKERM
jgi:hypothetical protein